MKMIIYIHIKKNNSFKKNSSSDFFKYVITYNKHVNM